MSEISSHVKEKIFKPESFVQNGATHLGLFLGPKREIWTGTFRQKPPDTKKMGQNG